MNEVNVVLKERVSAIVGVLLLMLQGTFSITAWISLYIEG
jgi:hypothetical protein